MATALQQQLATIAVNSTHQLDLKAQKARHSKSLLFEPRDAATQSFDTVYQICYEGFEELCTLDARFGPFGRNLFSEQSKYEDRTQMTAKENEELDKILDSFLGLVCGRLLLKPAMKAVEWLVRRFRIQEYNTQSVLLTFLPYHTSDVFPTLLSILPEQLPPSFKFLHPYVASLQSPPRHAVLSATVSNQSFFSGFNHYVLKVAKARHQSAILIGFWASITAQAVNGIIDSSRSGRDNIRQQREEDLLLRLLPVLQSALRIKGIPELYLGVCMIVTILATKASLEDKVLDALMEAVAGAWTEQTLEEGVTCLTVVAEEKQQVSIPASLTKALLKHETVLPTLVQLAESQRVTKLATAAAVGSLAQACESNDVTEALFSTFLLDADILPDRYTVLVLEKLLSSLKELRQSDPGGDVAKCISGLLSSFTEEPEDVPLLEMAARNVAIDLQELQFPRSILPRAIENEPEPVPSDEMDVELQESNALNGLGAFLMHVPQLQNESFFHADNDEAFPSYSAAFQTSISSERSMDRFLSAPSFRKSELEDHLELLTFLARMWSSDVTTPAKVEALRIATITANSMKEEKGIDMQAIFPYILTALADLSKKVRKETAGLCLAVKQLPGKHCGKDVQVWAESKFYSDKTEDIHWLSSDESFKFFKVAVLTHLEDSVMDAGYIVRSLADMLNQEHGELKKQARHACYMFLASHAAVTPVLRVRLILLQLIGKVGKVMGDARLKMLLPVLKQWSSLTSEEVSRACSGTDIDSSDMDKAMLGILSHRAIEDIQTLQSVANGKLTDRDGLCSLAFDRLRHIWPKMRTAWQTSLVDFLLDLALELEQEDEVEKRQDHALETLRNLELPTEILTHILESLPNAMDLQDQPSSAKKQRTGRTESAQPRSVNQEALQDAVRRVTLVLELVEASKPERHPQLLKGLFHLLSELHHYKTLAGSELVYLQQLVLGCLLAVIDILKTTASADIDRSVIRTDLIVECVRTTSSTQIHNAALLLVSSLASWAPDLVLHSVMPLFTFMGSTLLRQSDDFSAHVTDQTVARIVPPLAASLKKRGKDLVTGASELLLSFTAAFEHIPLHRRAGVFEHLAETLGPDDTLFAIVAMLVERYPNDSRLPAFIADLVNSFPAVTALRAAGQYINLVFDGLKPKRGLSETLLSFKDQDSDEIEEALETLLEGHATLLQSSVLRNRLAAELAKNDDGAENIRSVYASLLEQTMKLARDLASNEALKDGANSVLLSTLGLMPTKDFIESSAQLMQTGSVETRQQVFRSLEARVAQAPRGDAVSQKTFIEVLPNCGAFVRQDQPVDIRHAAISCIDQISERYGKTDRAAVLDAAKEVAGGAGLGSGDHSLRIISILCLASMTEVLGTECIAILPNALTQTFGYLQESKFDLRLLVAGFGLVNAVLDHLPWMLSAAYLDQALKLADPNSSRTAEMPSDPIQDFCSLVAKKVSASELFAAIERNWTDVCHLGREAVDCHLRIFHQAIQHHTKSTITKNAQILFTAVLQAFDVRRQFQEDDGNQDSDDELYPLVDKIALDLTLKLNDATFRPFFIRLVEWATNSLPKKEIDGRAMRMISLYSFSLALFDQLQSIVTSYSSFLLDNASALLQAPLTGKPLDRELLDLVLQTLSSSFRHDQDDFWQSPTHFDSVAVPLMDQLKNAKVLQVTDQVIPTVTDLAGAAGSPEHHKTMNATIMAYMRDEDAAVRLAAVKCERSITERVNFDWLALLPEMLPFISELQEDDDENVERETLRWVKQIEDVTGESLEGMLA